MPVKANQEGQRLVPSLTRPMLCEEGLTYLADLMEDLVLRRLSPMYVQWWPLPTNAESQCWIMLTSQSFCWMQLDAQMDGLISIKAQCISLKPWQLVQPDNQIKFYWRLVHFDLVSSLSLPPNEREHPWLAQHCALLGSRPFFVILLSPMNQRRFDRLHLAFEKFRFWSMSDHPS